MKVRVREPGCVKEIVVADEARTGGRAKVS
jgi:hypothetical protein